MSAHPNHCARCPARWGGLLTAHCNGCHLTFTGLTAFDKHRDGPHTARKCLTPDSVGLVLTNRLYPCYGFPNTDNNDYWETDE